MELVLSSQNLGLTVVVQVTRERLNFKEDHPEKILVLCFRRCCPVLLGVGSVFLGFSSNLFLTIQVVTDLTPAEHSSSLHDKY